MSGRVFNKKENDLARKSVLKGQGHDIEFNILTKIETSRARPK
jgi:hypothetical protein